MPESVHPGVDIPQSAQEGRRDSLSAAVDSIRLDVAELHNSLRSLSETLDERGTEVDSSVANLRARVTSTEVATDSQRLQLDALASQMDGHSASLLSLADDLSSLARDLGTTSTRFDTLIIRAERRDTSIRNLESDMSDQAAAFRDAGAQRATLAAQIRWLGLGGGGVLLLIGAITVWASHRGVLRRAHTASAAMVDRHVEAAATQLGEKLIGSDGELARRLSETNVAENHEFALAVAGEVTRMEGNLDRMDANIRGYKQLHRSLSEIRANLTSAGYELIPHIGKPYDPGLLVEVDDFVFDDSLPEGATRITRVFRPEVRFGGQILQAASIQVTEGPEAS